MIILFIGFHSQIDYKNKMSVPVKSINHGNSMDYNLEVQKVSQISNANNKDDFYDDIRF